MTALRPVGSSMRRQSTACIAHLEAPRAESSRHACRHFASSSTASYEAKYEDPALYESEKRMIQQALQAKGQKKQKAIFVAQQFAKAMKRPSVAETIKSAEARALDGDLSQMLKPSDANADESTPDSQVRDILERANKALDKWYDSREAFRYEEDGVYEEKEAETYRKQYKLAHERIGQALVVKQLRVLAGLKSRANKNMAIQKIMEGLGWDVPVAKEQTKITPKITRDLRLPENELFLFLRDTQTIHDFIMDHGVSFSVEDAKTLNNAGQQLLRATGPEESINKLVEEVEERSRNTVVVNITSESIHHFQPPAGLLKFVSDVTGTHVSVVNEADYQVSAMSPAKAKAVERCLQVAALRASPPHRYERCVADHQSHILPAAASSALVTPPPQADPEDSASETSDHYSAYPYIPTPSMLIPWHNLVFSFAEPLHRLRRVGEWSTRAGRKEMKHRNQAVQDGQVYPVESGEQGVSLAHFVESSSTGDRTTTLTFGQLLMRNGRDAPGNILTSPVPGQFPAIDSRSRLQAVSDRIFSPCLTPSMLHKQLNTPSRQRRRLTYRSTDGKQYMTYTYQWPTASMAQPADPGLTESEELHENWLQKLDSLLEQEKYGSIHANAEDDSDSFEADLTTGGVDILGDLQKVHSAREAALSGASKSGADIDAAKAVDEDEDLEGKLVVEKGSVNEVDLMLPDRPVDARLTTRSSSVIDATEVPGTIAEFFDQVVSEADAEEPRHGDVPEAPLALTVDGTTYMLERDEQLHAIESSADENVVLRTVHTKDMVLGVERYTSHTELEYVGKTPPATFWREMANTSRDVPPAGSSLARGGYSF